METGPRFKVSSDRLVKRATPGLQGKRFIHYTTAAPTVLLRFNVNDIWYLLHMCKVFSNMHAQLSSGS